jgi:L-threonylcarbamoyladenylate synthase
MKRNFFSSLIRSMYYLCQKKILIRAVKAMRYGGIIAFPTEAVYGLSCDPFSEKSIKRILAMKKRSIDKGFILLASSWEQFEHLIEPVSPEMMVEISASWPGPVTWVFPAKKVVPYWVTGAHDTVAIRISSHQLVRALCQAYGSPIISTSANVEGHPPARNRREVHDYFPSGIDTILPGKLGDLKAPTEIRDARTGEIIRSS